MPDYESGEYTVKIVSHEEDFSISTEVITIQSADDYGYTLESPIGEWGVILYDSSSEIIDIYGLCDDDTALNYLDYVSCVW